MILKNKYFKVFLLLFFVSVIIIPWLVFGEGDMGSGYRVDDTTLRKVVHYIDSSNTATTSTCLLNKSSQLIGSSKNYFVPTKTYDEWQKFSATSNLIATGVQAPVSGCINCGDNICDTIGGETNANCPSDCLGTPCDINPANGFIGAAYTTVMDTGAAGGRGCDSSNAFGITNYTVNFTPSSVVYQDPEGSQGHNSFTKWYTQCATLFKAPQMCTNNYCVMGVTYPDIYNAGIWHDSNKLLPHNATFYYGHYDATLHICVAGDPTSGSNGQYPQIIGGNPNIYTAGQLSILDQGNPWTTGVISANKYDTVGSWGSYTNCGDHVCDGSRGESTSNCITDCGSPTGVCVDNTGCAWNQTCHTSCFPTVDCSGYSASGTCSAVSGCRWNPASGFDAHCESIYTCSGNSTQTSCQSATGCNWKGSCY